MHYGTKQVPQVIRMTDILDLVAVEQLAPLLNVHGLSTATHDILPPSAQHIKLEIFNKVY
jgi:hypothetical protein